MDAILTDPHIDTRIKICNQINVIVPKLSTDESRRRVGRERDVRQTIGNNADDSSSKYTRMLKYDEEYRTRNEPT